MWHFFPFNLSPLYYFLYSLPAFLFLCLTLSKSAQTHVQKRQTCEPQCPSWTGFSNKTLSLRITLALRPSMTSADSCAAVATSNLRLRKKGRWIGGEEIGRELKSSVEASEMPGLHNSSQALCLWAPPFSCSSPLFSSFFSGKWWMLQRNEGGEEGGGGESHADIDPLGTTSGSLSETTLWWPLKCLSGSNLNPGRQAQYPDQEKPVLLHSWAVQKSLFTLGLNEDGRRATEEK